MKLSELIKELTAADIRLWLEQGQLRYSAPAGAMSSQRREWILARKEELIQFLANAGRRQIAPAPQQDLLPLSHAQERLWCLEQLEGPSGLYNEGRALCIQGPLNLTALQQALERIVQRHQVLRTAFPVRDGVARAQVQDTVAVQLQETDLSTLPLTEDERRRQALELLSLESQRPFDLEQAPLARFPLVRISAESHALGVFMHHLICDGLSVRVFFEELSNLYAALCQQQGADLPALPLQYGDFAHWQREHSDQVATQRDLSYWRRQLNGVEPMGLGDGVGEARGNQGQVYRFELDGALMGRLDQLARRSGVTRFVLISAAYHVLLGACANQREVVFSTPVTERQHSEVQNLIGLFVNALVLRQQLPAELSFEDLLGRNRSLVNQAFAHQQAPFERVVDAVAHDRGQRPVVTEALNQARLVYLEGVPRQLDFHNLAVEPFAVNRRLAKFGLMLTLERDGVEDGTVCRCDFEYKTAMFSAGYIEQMARAFQHLLEQIAAKPYCSLGELCQAVRGDLAASLAAYQEQRQHQRQASLRSLRRRAVG